MAGKKVEVHAMIDDVDKFFKHLPPDLKKLYEKFELKSAPTKKDFLRESIEKRGLMTHIPEWNLEHVYLVTWRAMFEYSRTAGYALGTFLEGLKNGKILGRRCHGCGRVLVPPRLFCEWCFKDTDEWVEVADTGTVSTFSISYIGTDPKVRLEKPVINAVIWLDGTRLETPSSKTVRHWGGFMHKLGEVSPDDVRIGMRVKAVWEPPEKRRGSILDIKYFKPV